MSTIRPVTEIPFIDTTDRQPPIIMMVDESPRASLEERMSSAVSLPSLPPTPRSLFSSPRELTFREVPHTPNRLPPLPITPQNMLLFSPKGFTFLDTPLNDEVSVEVPTRQSRFSFSGRIVSVLQQDPDPTEELSPQFINLLKRKLNLN